MMAGMLYAVLCVPRSGSSLVAGILHTLGVSMGQDLIPGDHWNPDGFFTDEPFGEALNQFFVDDWTGALKPDDKFARKMLGDYLATRAKEKDFGIKDYRLAYLWERIATLLPKQMQLVTTMRPVADSCKSLALCHERDGAAADTQDIARFIALYAGAVQKVLAAWRGPVLSVDYYALLDNPAIEVQRLADFVGRSATPAALAMVKPEYRRA